MAEWSSRGLWLLRDAEFAGLVDTPELAAEIVAAMNVYAAMRHTWSRPCSREPDTCWLHGAHPHDGNECRDCPTCAVPVSEGGRDWPATGRCSVCGRTAPTDVVNGEYRLGYHENTRAMLPGPCRGTGTQA